MFLTRKSVFAPLPGSEWVNTTVWVQFLGSDCINTSVLVQSLCSKRINTDVFMQSPGSKYINTDVLERSPGRKRIHTGVFMQSLDRIPANTDFEDEIGDLVQIITRHINQVIMARNGYSRIHQRQLNYVVVIFQGSKDTLLL